MGVGGHFWDLLKPYARTEDFDFLRDKKVAVDLSFWTVQHETAIKKRGIARNPHLRIAFFRSINLFSKLGAFPVFVLDGVPSRLKAQARIARFLQATGIDLSGLPVAEEGVPIERNRAFTRCIQECVELLELLGMPILRARCEAEALCAQLNSEGHVDACITADSDAFLYGAKCVIKCLRSNSKEPFECYHMSEIEAGLGLKRKQLVAISLLVGNDHDLQGVPGIGVDTALRFVQLFPEDEILNRLCEVGKGDVLLLRGSPKAVVDCNIATGDETAKTRSPHCSHCGHPGSKRAHLKDACTHCNVYGYEKCMQKPAGFKCECFICDKDRRSKQLKRHENWQIKICKKIAAEQNFPNDEIIEMYLSENHWSFSENDGLPLFWGSPRIEALVDFLAYHQHWEPSYIRQRMLPMLSTIFLREMASKPKDGLLLCDQYEFHSIQRVKIRYGHQFYLVKWKRAIPSIGNVTYTIPNEESDSHQSEPLGVESADVLDEPDVPEILVDDGCWFLLTDENMELVQAAFPKEVDRFLLEKELKESKSKGKKSRNKAGNGDRSGSPKSSGIQLSITEFYRSTKVLVQATNEEDPAKNSENSGEAPMRKSKKRVTRSSSNLPKSVRKRLLFH